MENVNKVTTLLSNKSLNEGTTVILSLSNNGDGGKRISVNENLTLGEIGVNPQGGAAAEPSFADVQLRVAQISAGAGTPDSKATAIRAEMDSYQAQVAQFKQAGGQNITDRVMQGVCNWLVANKGFTTADEAGKPRISAADLQVTAIQTQGGEMVFNVVGSSVWG